MKSTDRGGWSLLELVISLALVGILISLAIPSFMRNIEASHAMTCFIYRKNIETAADLYVRTHRLEPGDLMPTIPELVAEDLLPGEDHCPAGGIYVWTDPVYQGYSTPFRISCSLHFLLPEKEGKYRKNHED